MNDNVLPKKDGHYFVYKEETIKKTMRIPISLVEKVSKIATEKHRSFSYIVAYLIQEGLTSHYNKEE